MVRFTSRNPCPVCGGNAALPRGHSQRCYGFLSDDGKWAHCTREERAGPLVMEPESQTYAHLLEGGCRCGGRHVLQPNVAPPPSSEPEKKRMKIDTTYDYRDAMGALLYQVVRLKEPKDFLQRRPLEAGRWNWSLGGVGRVHYRLPELLKQDLDELLWYAEGEKDVDLLYKHGLPATTHSGGAKKAHLTPDWSWAHGRTVVVLPDNDLDGHAGAQQVALFLFRAGARVRIMSEHLEGLHDHADIGDWFEAGGKPDKLRAMYARAAEFIGESPQPTPSDPIPLPVGDVVKSNGHFHARNLEALNMAAVHAMEMDWLWYGWLARGGLTFLQGDPGVGKGWISLAIATHLSLGKPLPREADVVSQPRRTILFSAEDDPAHTIKPRLELLGADPSQIEFVTGTRNERGDLEAFSLADIEALSRHMLDFKPSLVVIDPLDAYLGATVDTHRSAAVRSTIMPLAQVMMEQQVACLGVIHQTKGQRDTALYRGQGSVAFNAAARVVALAGKDPELSANGEIRGGLITIKNNLGVWATPLGYAVSSSEAAVFGWTGDSTLTAEDLQAPTPTRDMAQAQQAAAEDLRDLLHDGAQTQPTVMQRMGRLGHSTATIHRTRTFLVKAGELDVRKAGFNGGWTWSLMRHEDRN